MSRLAEESFWAIDGLLKKLLFLVFDLELVDLGCLKPDLISFFDAVIASILNYLLLGEMKFF